MQSAFSKEVVRSIAHSAGRFAAIAIISLLGAGFYAGLRMSAPDMRIAGDEFFDGANLYDISVMTTLGVDDDNLASLQGVEGVGAVMPAYHSDAMVLVGDNSYAASIESLPVKSALASDTSDGETAQSDDANYMNRPILLTGAWPIQANECVVGVNAAEKLGIAIGDTVKVEKATTDLEDTFAQTSFKVTGLVNSPAFAQFGQLGITSLGTGTVEMYLYVPEIAFAEDYPYTFAYLTLPSASGESWGTGGYDEAVSTVKEKVEDVASEVGDARYNTVKGDAQKELDDARADYESERADAEGKLADAASQLDDARSQLDSAAAEMASGKADLDSAAKTLEESEAKLRAGEEDYAKGKAELDSNYAAFQEQAANLPTMKEQSKQVDDGIAQAQAGIATIDQNLAEAQAGVTAIQQNLAEAQAGKTAIEQNLAEAQAGVATLQQQLAQAKAAGAPAEQIAALEQKLAEATAMVSTLEQKLAETAAAITTLEQKLAETTAAVSTLQQKRAETQATITELQNNKKQLDEGIAAIEQGEAEFAKHYQELDSARAQLDDAKKQLDDGRGKYQDGLAEYYDGVSQYYSGLADYESGLAEYQSNRDEAYEKFADAEAELADAQKDIDDIERPDVYVTNRDKNYGAAQLASDADGIAQIALFLPFMFFLVAALVSLTSMTRMVDEERMIIGTHKALGYSKARITAKYLIYGVLASGIGSVAGVLLFGQLLPWIIMTAYQVTYAVPQVPTPIHLDVAAKAVGLSVGVTAIATWGAAAASLREKPAALMLPRVPKAGKRIFLERITPLWSRMSFSHKVTARNLLRYKRRFFMAVVGIAGCTALLLIGFGMRDAIGGVVWNQFDELVNYDVAVRIDDEATDDARKRVEEVFASDAVDARLNVRDFNMVAAGPDGDMRIEVVVPEDGTALPDFVALRERVGKNPLTLEGEGIILTEKAATVLGLHAGDTVTLFDENDVGDATGEGRSFTVAGIAENYLGHYAYMLPGAYRAAFGEEPVNDLTYVKLADGADRDAFSDALLAIDGVNTVSFVSETIKTYQEMLDLMVTIIFVIIVLSAALAFVVLYNLTNINIEERIREIATLKVLGFTKPEVHAYIFREIIVMAIIGALLGCIIGVPLTSYISQAAETPQMMFGREIAPLSFVLSFVITMVFAAFVAFTMRRKLARVNMVESLKSVE